MLLIDDILLAPFTGFKFILRTLGRVAEEQYTDDAPLKQELLELQLLLENGEIGERNTWRARPGSCATCARSRTAGANWPARPKPNPWA